MRRSYTTNPTPETSTTHLHNEKALHKPTIPTPTPSQPQTPTSPLIPLPPLINPQNQTRHENQPDQIHEPQRFGLENPLQRREIDNQSLTQQRSENRVVEHLVAFNFARWKEGNFAKEDGFSGAAAGEGVEHVEEDELGECQGCVAVRDGVCCEVGGGEVGDVGVQRAEQNDGGRLENATEDALGEDAGVAGARGLGEEGWVDGFDAERLCGWAVHEDV